MRQVILVAHNIRSTHNVGAFFRTCDGLGVSKIIFGGYTPYPALENDTRLPHFADKITRQIHKTALGAESVIDFEYIESYDDILKNLRNQSAVLVALEQYPGSLTPLECRAVLDKRHFESPVALLVGNEIHGVNDEILKQVDYVMEIPMHGTKESLNVSVATAIALYELTKTQL